MLKKDGWQKKFLRVKQIADQNLGRAEKSEVLSEDLLGLEKRVDLIKQVCSATHKKLSSCMQGQGGADMEKRLKKMPESLLSHSMLESSQILNADTPTLMGKMFQLCGECENSRASELLQYEVTVENQVLFPLQNLIDTEIASIHRGRKQLTKMVLDMDSARARYQSAMKQSQHSSNYGTVAVSAKVDHIRDEMEEASQRVEQCRDQLATDIYTFVSKEADHCQLLIDLMHAQAQYHRKALEALDSVIPQINEQMEQACVAPVFGGSLEDHLKRMNRDIAYVLEECVCTLLLYGMNEEGLFRIAAGASKVKKLKAAFNSGMVDMSEFDNDIHCVAGTLKLYLRELPDPLMTCELYHEWMQAASLPQDQKLQALWCVLDKLPKLNYYNLRYLIKFLAKLAENQDVNKMSPSNIAIVMGPNLMWAPGDGGPSMLSTSMQSSIVESLISHADWFFPEDIDFGVTPASASPTQSDSNGSASQLDSNQNVSEHTNAFNPSGAMSAMSAAMLAPSMILQPGVINHSSQNTSQESSPPPSMTTSTGSLPPSDEKPAASPKISRRGTKKPPAPLPPVVPERPHLSAGSQPVAEKHSVHPDPSVQVTPPVDAPKPVIPERPQGPPPVPPAPTEKLYPSLASITESKPEKPDKPNSPRPRGPPPDRPPTFPNPEKPQQPVHPNSEKPMLPNRPTFPNTEAQSTQRNDRQGNARPPRPMPPPPPPPEKRTSLEKPAPIAEQEPISPLDASVVEATHL